MRMFLVIGLIAGMIALSSGNVFAAAGKMGVIEHNSAKNFNNQPVAF